MATFTRVCLVLVSTLGVLLAAPAGYHDQRQNGNINVRSHLGNFIVVLIPTSGEGSLSWLDFSKRLNLQNHLKYVRDDKPKDQEKSSSVRESDDEETRRVAAPVILEKTPYTVDVEIQSKQSPLSRLHPLPVLDMSSDVMIALSPSVSLSKSAETVPESSKKPVKLPPAPEVATEPHKTPMKVPAAPEKADAFIISPIVPEKAPKAPEAATEATLRPQEVKPLEEPARMVKKPKSILSTTLDRVHKTEQEEKEQRLRLLGAGIEVCAPHERRGDDGNCEPIKARRRSGQYFSPSGLLPALRFGLSPANE